MFFQMQQTLVGVYHLLQVDVLLYNVYERVFCIVFFVHTGDFIQCYFGFYYDGSKNTTREIATVGDKVDIRIKAVL